MLFLPKQPCGMPRIDRNEENFSRVSIRRCLFRMVKRLVGAQRINGNSPKCAQDRSTSNMAINIQDNSSYQANNIGTIRRSRSFPHIRLTCAMMESGDNPTPFRRICSKGGKAQWCLICQIRIRRLSVFFGVAVRRVLGVVAIQCFRRSFWGRGFGSKDWFTKVTPLRFHQISDHVWRPFVSSTLPDILLIKFRSIRSLQFFVGTPETTKLWASSLCGLIDQV